MIHEVVQEYLPLDLCNFEPLTAACVGLSLLDSHPDNVFGIEEFLSEVFVCIEHLKVLVDPLGKVAKGCKHLATILAFEPLHKQFLLVSTHDFSPFACQGLITKTNVHPVWLQYLNTWLAEPFSDAIWVPAVHLLLFDELVVEEVLGRTEVRLTPVSVVRLQHQLRCESVQVLIRCILVDGNIARPLQGRRMLSLVVVYLDHAYFTDGVCLDRYFARFLLEQPFKNSLPTVLVVDLEGGPQLHLRLQLH